MLFWFCKDSLNLSFQLHYFLDNQSELADLVFWFLGVDAFHRKESGHPLRDFALRPDRAYKLEIQLIACILSGEIVENIKQL